MGVLPGVVLAAGPVPLRVRVPSQCCVYAGKACQLPGGALSSWTMPMSGNRLAAGWQGQCWLGPLRALPVQQLPGCLRADPGVCCICKPQRGKMCRVWLRSDHHCQGVAGSAVACEGVPTAKQVLYLEGQLARTSCCSMILQAPQNNYREIHARATRGMLACAACDKTATIGCNPHLQLWPDCSSN